MGCFIFIASVRRGKDAGHHCKGAEGCGDHVAHNISIIVLQRPYKATLAPDDSGHSIVNESIEILDSLLFKLFLIELLVYILEGKLECFVILLADGILCAEPEILVGIKGKGEAGVGEGGD